jgi:hypothetical protein
MSRETRQRAAAAALAEGANRVVFGPCSGCQLYTVSEIKPEHPESGLYAAYWASRGHETECGGSMPGPQFFEGTEPVTLPLAVEASIEQDQ